MKVLEEVKYFRKDAIYEQYTKILFQWKDYDKITRQKMIEGILDVYQDYHNIIDICMTRELKFLKMYLEKNPHYKDKKYEWERNILKKKFLLTPSHKEFNDIEIYEELYDNIKLAVSKVNWKEAKEKDRINEFLVSYCKVQGSCLAYALAQIGSQMLDVDETTITQHIFRNRLFRYYVWLYDEEIEGLGEQTIASYDDYWDVLEELKVARKEQGGAASFSLSLKDYQTLFYNDFNINNPKIKKFYRTLLELPCYHLPVIQRVQEYALLNKERDSLKESIARIPILKNYDLTEFFKELEEAMDEMPSGALNGMTPKEAIAYKQEEQRIEEEKQKNYTPQQNACLNQNDAKLFYKIYFALLDYTNQLYKIEPHVKIYQQTGINPYQIADIVDKFWEEKEKIIPQFEKDNLYKFHQEELQLAKEFKKGIRDFFMIARFEKEYTAFLTGDRVYMVKGINANLDEIISYQDLPAPVVTSLVSFKNTLVYDGMLYTYPIQLGGGIVKQVEKDYNALMKYYHL